MTAINLLECLEEFVKEKTADIKLQVKVRNRNPQEVKERAADVYKMRLPKKEDQTEKVPYILLQFLTGKDDKENGEPQESDCKMCFCVSGANWKKPGLSVKGSRCNTRLNISYTRTAHSPIIWVK